MSENKASPAFLRGETGTTRSFSLFFFPLFLFFFLFFYITRFKAQTIPCDKCLIADGFLSPLPFQII